MTRANPPVGKTFVSRQFVGFVITGGLAACVNWGSRILYNRWMPYSPAIVVAYITGMITAYVLARLFVFTASVQTTGRSILFFILVNVAAAAQTWAVSVLFAYYLFPRLSMTWHAPDIAHLIGVVVPVFTSYIGHKKFSFRSA